MKRGISLIVLVITIIVMIILAAAIIISISNSNVINKANKAVEDTNIATIKEAAALKFADVTLAIKETGNDSILGGKTVGEYIEQELINDGTMKESDAVIFTPKGGVYGSNEYNSIPDKDEVSDWRGFQGKLYYFGLDINKRKSLKTNVDVNTDYIYVYSNMDANSDHIYTLSDIGYLGKVGSFDELLGPEGNLGANSSFNSSSVGETDNVVLSNGIVLYDTSGTKIGQVILAGDLNPDGIIDFDNDFSTAYYIMVAEGENGVSIENLFTDYGIKSTYTSSINLIIRLTLDLDMNAELNDKDQELLSVLSTAEFAENWSFEYGKAMKDMYFYNNDSTTFAGNPLQPFYQANYNIDKIITRLPADIAK